MDSSNAEVNIAVAEKVINSFNDNFVAMNRYMIDSNKEMGEAELPEFNQMVKDPAAIKNYLKNGDCIVFQDR